MFTFIPTLLLVTFATFSDGSYTNQTTRFTTGEQIYFKVESISGGEKTKSLKILDENKKELASYTLVRGSKNGNAYMYTYQFTAPTTRGTYYVDVKLDDGGGKTFSGQRNINIIQSGPTSALQQVSPTPANTNVFKQNSTSSGQNNDAEFGEENTDDAPLAQAPKNIVETIALFVKNIISSIFRS
jgi:hypothetical protein